MSNDDSSAADRGSGFSAGLGALVERLLKYSDIRRNDPRENREALRELILGEFAEELQAARNAERLRLAADAETWGSALNEASWAMTDAYRRHTGQVESAIFFNNGKAILRDALAAYFNALRA